MIESLRTASFGAGTAEAADHLDIHAGLRSRVQQSQHRGIADLRVVDQQFLLRALEKRRELLARIQGTHDKGRQAGHVRLALGVGFEELHRFGDQLGVAWSPGRSSGCDRCPDA